MEILLAALVSAIVSGAVALLALRSRPPQTVHPGAPAGDAHGPQPRARPRGGAANGAPEPPAPNQPAAPEAGQADDPTPAQAELRSRRDELARLEERLRAKEQSVDSRLRDVDHRERTLDDRGRNLDLNTTKLKQARK
jgi:hypothetical protein